MRKSLVVLGLLAVGGLGAGYLSMANETPTASVVANDKTAMSEMAIGEAAVDTYAHIALAMYEDAASSAQTLKIAVDALSANPTTQNLMSARAAWIASRVPYQQTEGLRFGNAAVDEWEGRVNAWPLDEGLLDYVDPAYGETSEDNPLYAANLVANTSIRIGREVLDTTVVTKELLSQKLHEALGVEANVATGYHAIEFMLWGQDLNGTNAGAGARPVTDFDAENCTNGNCARRAHLIQVLSDLLVDDLNEMVAAWSPGGQAQTDLANKTAEEGLSVVFTGLGSLSYGELAGERIKLGLILHDPEEEHDCFSDNTHNAHFYNQIGMLALYNGRYTRTDGSIIEGVSVADYVSAKAPEQAKLIAQRMEETRVAMDLMRINAEENGIAYDQMLGANNEAGNAIIQTVVDTLVAQARALEAGVVALGLSIEVEGSDSLE
ncbi:MAG: peptidase [Parvibaculaceae bacterium]|nr:peptidase [Parvibaculaceae bacterium]